MYVEYDNISKPKQIIYLSRDVISDLTLKQKVFLALDNLSTVSFQTFSSLIQKYIRLTFIDSIC